jgi:hypothetical protein
MEACPPKGKKRRIIIYSRMAGIATYMLVAYDSKNQYNA